MRGQEGDDGAADEPNYAGGMVVQPGIARALADSGNVWLQAIQYTPIPWWLVLVASSPTSGAGVGYSTAASSHRGALWVKTAIFRDQHRLQRRSERTRVTVNRFRILLA